MKRDLTRLPKPHDLKKYLKGFDFFERHVHGQWEGDLYAETHATRFYETLKFLPELEPGARVLELGAVPYYFTILVERFADVRPDVVSFFEVEKCGPATHTVENVEFGERYEFPYRPL